MNVSTPLVLRFLSVIRHDSSRYTHAFIEKAQHLWRWISLRTLTRGRLVPRQPWAIKRTTRTELCGERICNVERFLWNISATPTALHCCNIRNDWYIHWNIGTTSTALLNWQIQNLHVLHGKRRMENYDITFLSTHFWVRRHWEQRFLSHERK